MSFNPRDYVSESKALVEAVERIVQLQALIQKHNGKCDFMCNPDVCGRYTDSASCPDCPKQWKIETAKVE